MLFRERAAQRAEEGIPLAALLRSYHVGSAVLMDALQAAAGPGDAAALLLLALWQVTGLGAAVEQVTEGYLTGLADQHSAARDLARALVHGDDAETVAARHGLSLAPGYLVLSVRPAPAGPRSVPGRRLLRQVLGLLPKPADGQVLSLPDDHGGCLLLPAGTSSDGLAGRLTARLPEPPVVGAAFADGPAGVPAAADQARRIAGLVTEPGVHRLRDVLLDYHLARPADSAAALTALLEPLDGHPGLTDTVRAFLDGDSDRRRTAETLGVHPNTVDNRLTRALELTGVDPRTTRGVQLFGAALTLRRLADRARDGADGAG
ncbi:PucR family transcriptional regulator [Streptomyces sp. NPDC001922]|uniref:PucR family transcriptional regulator n=1 Tax=Streptomyces sp. NPDC001922 TaxID=3364624 RepID=UPI003685E663